jgi:class 3 adenylate cyclase
MGLKEDLQADVAEIFRERWNERNGRGVPDPEDLALSNDAVNLEATVLYADMADSTDLVDNKKPFFAAEIYKTYLICAARIIKAEGGAISAYDGDRIMAVFVGDYKNSIAARTALKLNSAVHDIINPALAKQYPQETYRVRHHVGVDTSSLFVCRVGVRNDNDLVWVGRAANYAAKLCAIKEYNTVFITDTVFKSMNDTSKYSSGQGTQMWTERKWSQMNDKRVYSSTWKWSL